MKHTADHLEYNAQGLVIKGTNNDGSWFIKEYNYDGELYLYKDSDGNRYVMAFNTDGKGYWYTHEGTRNIRSLVTKILFLSLPVVCGIMVYLLK